MQKVISSVYVKEGWTFFYIVFNLTNFAGQAVVTRNSQAIVASNFDHIVPTKDGSSCPRVTSKTLTDFQSKIKVFSIFNNMLAKDYRNSYHFQRL